MRASAPGKLHLAGEYSVLEGGIAVVMAVDRRARAWIADGRQPSPFLDAAEAALAAALGPASPPARAAARVQVDTTSMRAATGEKLGLGSSAAATVAAMAACLGTTGSLDRALLHRLAHRAHGHGQANLARSTAARGSGADIAASVWGGLLLLEPVGRGAEPPAVTPLALPASLELVTVWTGQPADTRLLVAAIRALASREPATYMARIDAIAGAAASLVAACQSASAPSAIDALTAGGVAVRELGAAAGVALFLDCHHALAERASLLGGALKPTGAAGGDVALAAFDGPDPAQQFRAHVESLGMHTVDLRVDAMGAVLDDDSP
jgi:mevalonate kinase